MKKQISIVLFILFYNFGFSQSTETIYPNFIGESIDYIENNSVYEILKKSSGDLNKDGNSDFVLILESRDSIPEKRCSECYLLKNKARIIVVILNHSDNKKTIIQNNNFIARGDEGGMASYVEPELLIKNGQLEIYYEYTRSNQSYTFELKKERMEIVSAESNTVHSATGNYENAKFDFKNGEIISRTGNISQDKIETKIIKFDIEPKSLAEFNEMYEWKITEYKYL